MLLYIPEMIINFISVHQIDLTSCTVLSAIKIVDVLHANGLIYQNNIFLLLRTTSGQINR